MSPHPASGIYIHWPFCARKCPYCDFYTFGAEHPQFTKSELYLRALIAEIESLPERWKLTDRPVADTIYFGGGTPSLIEPYQLKEILRAVGCVFAISKDAEITLEVNPTAAEAARLVPAREMGVNRLSVGCQSFDDKFLRLLGRDHDSATARRILNEIPQLGFDNFSLDLMFSLPGQTLEDVGRDLATALEFNPTHISAYGLTLHEGTPFKRWNEEGRWSLPESDTQAAQFEMLMDTLAERGWEQYEISNWSRPGLRSRHNSKYWSSADVYAFGVSAHGVSRGKRYSNPRDLHGYMDDTLPTEVKWSVLEPPPSALRTRMGEIMMVALRRTEGVSWEEIQNWARAWYQDAPENPRSYYQREVEQLLAEDMLREEPNRLTLTRKGIMFADDTVMRFF